MPAVCKFYLKGYCRFGSNCRFSHPGENDYNDYNDYNSYNDYNDDQGPATTFSFKAALDNSNFRESSNIKDNLGFSFAKALESTSSYQQHHDIDMSVGFPAEQQLSSIFSQTYNNLHHQQQQQQQQLYQQQQQQQLAPSIFAPPSFQQQQQFEQPNQIVEESPYTNLNELTEDEVKAFEASKFEPYRIPIRPPPKIFCS